MKNTGRKTHRISDSSPRNQVRNNQAHTTAQVRKPVPLRMGGTAFEVGLHEHHLACSSCAWGHRGCARVGAGRTDPLPLRVGVPRPSTPCGIRRMTAPPARGGTASVMTFHHRVEDCSPGRGGTAAAQDLLSALVDRSPCAWGVPRPMPTSPACFNSAPREGVPRCWYRSSPASSAAPPTRGGTALAGFGGSRGRADSPYTRGYRGPDDGRGVGAILLPLRVGVPRSRA
jgi:hypothetical protein